MKYFFKRINIFVSNTIFQSSTKYVLMKKSIFLYIYLSICLSVNLNGQSTNSQDVGKGECIQRNATYNLEEIKVRWKKAALENCTGVPCVPFNCGTSAISDIDGNSYPTVLIGTQCWTKQNLKVSKYNDGTMISLDASGGSAGNNTSGGPVTWPRATGAYTIYENQSSTGTNATNYGLLYNWYAAKGISTVGSTTYKNICPTGWHVPSDIEWTTLIKHIDPTASASGTVYLTQSTNAGDKMKSTSTLWNSISIGTDDYGFAALPGGYRLDSGIFGNKELYAFFWSADENDINEARNRSLYFFSSGVHRVNYNKSYGGSIRCLRD
jgi:uncharacterized protein (TIGR02145 family)